MSTASVNLMLLGAIAALAFVAGLLFLRYWSSSGDRFFLFFTGSFWIESLNRIHMARMQAWTEDLPEHYVVRLVSYGLIVWAIWDKNRPGSR